MKTIICNAEDITFPYINKVTYTLICHTKKGIVVKVTMNGTTSQIFYWASWRRFKKWVG